MPAKTTGFVRRHKGTHAYQSLMLNGVLMPCAVSASIAAGAANVSEITFSVNDADGNVIPGSHALDIWLSDAATGEGLTSATTSGAVTVKATTGTDLGAFTAKKALRAITDAAGTVTLSITDTAKTLLYVGASIPSLGVAVITRKLVTGDYGT